MNERRIAKLRTLFLRETSNYLLTIDQTPHGKFVVITGVELSADLGWAKIFYSTMSGIPYERSAIEVYLTALTPKIRTHLAHLVDIRHMPEIRFVYDDTFEKAQRIDEIIRKIEHHEE